MLGVKPENKRSLFLSDGESKDPHVGRESGCITVLSVIEALLGMLWLVQGLGIIQIDPILCARDCEPITGRSVQWTVIGAIASFVGSVIVWRGWNA